MSLARSTLFVGGASIVSRILGFARDVLFAQALGAGPVADAFLAAFRLPNLLRRVLAEGGLNPALVPALAHLPPEEGRRFAGEVLSGFAFGLVALCALFEIAAGPIMLLMAPGLEGSSETFAAAILYSRLAFPLVVGVTLASIVAAVLNHRRRFAAAALAPLIVNTALIGLLFRLEGSPLTLHQKAAWLAAALSLSGLCQLGLVSLALLRRPPPIRLAPPRWSPALRRVLATGFLTVTASAAAQLFILAGAQVASFIPSAISWLYYADRVAQLPLGMIASGVGVVLLPELATRHVAGDLDGVLAAQSKALDASLLISLPAAAGLAALASPIATVLFQRGAFGPADAAGTAQALVGLAAGLPFAVAGKVLSQTLFARGSVRSPIAALAVGLAVTVSVALFLSRTLGILGIGIGIAAGSFAQAATLALALSRQGLWRASAFFLNRLGRMLIASAVLAAVLEVASRLLVPAPGSLAILCLGGLALYAALVLALGLVSPQDLAILAKKQ
jgi:putative peptidoglycan lipid II flippase